MSNYGEGTPYPEGAAHEESPSYQGGASQTGASYQGGQQPYQGQGLSQGQGQGQGQGQYQGGGTPPQTQHFQGGEHFQGGDQRYQAGYPAKKSSNALDDVMEAVKTSEFIVYVLAVLGVLIAAAVTDNDFDGGGFGASQAWWYVTLLTIGYMVTRGLTKSRRGEDDGDKY